MKNCMPSSARYGLPTTVGYNGHDVRKTRMPAYSFGARFPNSEKVESPGPNAYALPTTIGGGDKTGFEKKNIFARYQTTNSNFRRNFKNS